MPHSTRNSALARYATLTIGLLIGTAFMSSQATTERGFRQIASHHPVTETADRLESMLKTQGIMVFARIDFSGDAGRAGLVMRAEQLVIFGSPKAGTPLMLAEPTTGLDLPLKALIWEDAAGHSWVAYNDPSYIVQRHGLPSALVANLAGAVAIIERAAAE
jgi:uncharacterized protein (DUF302 family)